jgi:5-deoxy-glucuronate isomerase
VPRGSWTGWPPHRHDGLDGSPYLEETYYYRFDRTSGFGVHRTFDPARGLDELTPVRDGSLVPVPCGYHLCAAGPGSNAWILNFLAGRPEDRDQPPVFDATETWIAEDWSAGALELPAVTSGSASKPAEGDRNR